MAPPLLMSQVGRGSLESVLLTVGRLGGLALTGWLLGSQILYTVAVLTRTDWLTEILRPVTLPVVRRIAAGTTTLTMTFSGGAAIAQPAHEPIAVTVESGLRQEATPTPALQPLVEPEVVLTEPEGSYSAPLTWLVRPGDNLWRIADEHLTIVLNRMPDTNELCSYWVEVVNAARPVIRSGDPDLIYPGEEIPLPPTLDAGVRP